MKYVPGLMVGQLSGKAGSTVASRNKGGSYFRTRVIPKHVVNTLTAQVRANFGDNAQAFRSLTESGRKAWNGLGAQLTRKTSLGETIHLTGLQALQAINRNLFTIGAAPNYAAPVIENPFAIDGLSITAVSGAPLTTTVIGGANSAAQHVTTTVGMYPGATLFFESAGVFRTVATITDGTHVVLTEAVDSTTAENIDWTAEPTIHVIFDPSPVPTDTYLIIEATAPLSAGVSRPSRGQFRLLANAGPTTASPYDVSDYYTIVFGLPPAGSKIFIRAKLITASGFAGPALANFVIVT